MSLLSWERGLKYADNSESVAPDSVAPLVGAWIEIVTQKCINCEKIWSLLSWERGLKFGWCYTICIIASVAPLVGAWIEIFVMLYMSLISFVAPLVGAWIEIN